MTVQGAQPVDDENVSLSEELARELDALGFQVTTTPGDDPRYVHLGLSGSQVLELEPAPLPQLLENALRQIPCPVDTLPVLVEGDSKVVRLWTDRVVVEQFKPTVYSYTHNRYGSVEGTDRSRVRFSAALFREMAQLPESLPFRPRSAFLAEIEHQGQPMLVQRKVQTCNLEVRIKRYHIGSPLHRYHYTEDYPTNLDTGPLRRWSRFDIPVVCFDWRHPLRDHQGNRLADEPISEDYAAVWMRDVAHAREMARETFRWMEKRFASRNVLLVDMCLFVDAEGHLIYGEISPDCMRLRDGLGNPAEAEASAKDVWRNGGSSNDLAQRYEQVFEQIFGDR